MAHGGNGKRRVATRKPAPTSTGNRLKGPAGGVSKKPKTVSIKNQMRSVERLLRKKDLAPGIREAQEKKMEALKKQQEGLIKQQEIHNRLAVERKSFNRDRKIKFFERRKIERRIRRLEKMQRSSSGQPQEAEVSEQLSKLKEDLEYVRFFPKTEKYVALYSGREEAEIVDRRIRLRKQIKANLVAAAASGKDLEETGSEEDGLLDVSDDDFFAHGSSSDEGDADDELTDKSAREQASTASGKATSGLSSDERNQKQVSARALMPPPRPSASGSFSGSENNGLRFASSSRKKPLARSNLSTSSNTSNSRSFSSGGRGSSNPQTGRNNQLSFSSGGRGYSNPQTGQNSNLSFSSGGRGSSNPQKSQNSNLSFSSGGWGSSNPQKGQNSNLDSSSDARKPRRKRRPKKKKQ